MSSTLKSPSTRTLKSTEDNRFVPMSPFRYQGHAYYPLHSPGYIITAIRDGRSLRWLIITVPGSTPDQKSFLWVETDWDEINRLKLNTKTIVEFLDAPGFRNFVLGTEEPVEVMYKGEMTRRLRTTWRKLDSQRYSGDKLMEELLPSLPNTPAFWPPRAK